MNGYHFFWQFLFILSLSTKPMLAAHILPIKAVLFEEDPLAQFFQISSADRQKIVNELLFNKGESPKTQTTVLPTPPEQPKEKTPEATEIIILSQSPNTRDQTLDEEREKLLSYQESNRQQLIFQKKLFKNFQSIWKKQQQERIDLSQLSIKNPIDFLQLYENQVRELRQLENILEAQSLSKDLAQLQRQSISAERAQDRTNIAQEMMEIIEHLSELMELVREERNRREIFISDCKRHLHEDQLRNWDSNIAPIQSRPVQGNSSVSTTKIHVDNDKRGVPARPAPYRAVPVMPQNRPGLMLYPSYGARY